ncbi:MAG TPA: glycoside hydrolase family 28 protein [Victivallales bacterium]|nr:glycoside hydrolase family 28 protein [Victivallales bacterium]
MKGIKKSKKDLTPNKDIWKTAEEITSRVVPPTFPNRVFSIIDFGAKPDAPDNTAAFSRAISACHEAGGGRVLVPSGRFHSGPIHLKSNVNLHLEHGATVEFIPNEELYLPIVRAAYEGNELMGYSPLLYAFKEENIALSGQGTFNGHGDAPIWTEGCIGRMHQRHDGLRLAKMGEENLPIEQRRFGTDCGLRPNMLQFLYCKNILIEGLTFIQSPMWMLNPFACRNITIRNVTINNSVSNGDGIDPESCSDVLIQDCVLNTRDDCIAIKSGRDAEGRRRNMPTENVVVERCLLNIAPNPQDSRNGFAIGSEIAGGARNIFVRDCVIRSRIRGIIIKSNTDRGGIVENIHFRDIEIDDQVGRGCKSAIIMIMRYGDRPLDGPYPPTFRNFSFERIHAKQIENALALEGSPKSFIRDLRLSDCSFETSDPDLIILCAEAPVLERVSINGVQINQVQQADL